MTRLKVGLKVAKFQIQKSAAFNKQLCAMNKLAVGGFWCLHWSICNRV